MHSTRLHIVHTHKSSINFDVEIKDLKSIIEFVLSSKIIDINTAFKHRIVDFMFKRHTDEMYAANRLAYTRYL